jgi:hypothetical protein
MDESLPAFFHHGMMAQAGQQEDDIGASRGELNASLGQRAAGMSSFSTGSVCAREPAPRAELEPSMSCRSCSCSMERDTMRFRRQANSSSRARFQMIPSLDELPSSLLSSLPSFIACFRPAQMLLTHKHWNPLRFMNLDYLIPFS